MYTHHGEVVGKWETHNVERALMICYGAQKNYLNVLYNRHCMRKKKTK